MEVWPSDTELATETVSSGDLTSVFVSLPHIPVIRELVTFERVRFTTTTGTSAQRAVADAAVLMAVTALASLVVPEAFRVFLTGLGYRDEAGIFVIAGSVATLSLGVLAVVYLRRVHQVTIPLRRPAGREWGWIVAGIIIPVVLLLLIDVVSVLIGGGTADTGAAELDVPPVFFVYAIVWSLVAIGPIEGLLFRGVVQGRLREVFGPIAAIGLTALGFGIAHLPSYLLAGANPLSTALLVALTTITLGAIVLGAIYERTANLAVVILAHGLTDALIFAIVLVSVL